MNWLSRVVTTHRRIGWLLVLLLSVPPALGLYGFRAFENQSFRWGAEELTQQLSNAKETFSGNYSGFPAFAVLECDDFFQAARIAAIRRAGRRVVATIHESSPELEQPFVWIGTIERATLFGRQPILPESIESDDDARAVEELVAEHPLVAGQFLSEDRRTMLAGLNIGGYSFDSATIAALRDVLRKELEPVGIKVRITGPGPLWVAHREAFDADHHRILYTAAGLIVVLALIIFRGLPAIIIACSGTVSGVFWTVGWLALFGQSDNELAKVILPVMILMVSFTDGVHVVVHIRQQRVLSDGDLPRSPFEHQVDAAASAIRHVGGACLLTSLTTAIGFGSLLLADADMVQGFGRNCAIGVLIAFVAAILVIPLISVTRLGRHIHRGAEHDLVGRHIVRLSKMVSGVVRYSGLISVVSLAVTLLLGWQALQLEPDDRLGDRIPNDTEAYAAMRHVDRELGGVRLIRIVVRWPEDADRTTLWEIVGQIENMVATEPALARPLSVRDALSVLPGADAPARLNLARLLPASFRETFWNENERRTQILSRGQDIGIARYRPVLKRLEEQFDLIKREHPGFQIELTGEAIVESRIVRRVVEELFNSLLLAAVVIFVVITIAVRSIRFGILSVIPNVFPLALTGALRASFDTSLDIASACSFAVCLGIAVDDTIHFLMRFRHERELGHDVETSIRNTFVTVGSALVMTTVVMVSGLATCLSSDLPTHFHFSAMACSTIGAALLGDLLILPALLARFADRTNSESASPTACPEETE